LIINNARMSLYGKPDAPSNPPGRRKSARCKEKIMLHQLRTTILVSASVLLTGSFAFGQFERRSEYEPQAVNALVDQVHNDLNRAYSAWHLRYGDRDRLNNAERQLREFAQKWDNRRFDKGELDDAIGAIQHVLDNNRLEGHDRDAISDDVNRLRNMREAYDRHEIR
jgi:hypothetical protein